jgi:hypothetical protein
VALLRNYINGLSALVASLKSALKSGSNSSSSRAQPGGAQVGTPALLRAWLLLSAGTSQHLQSLQLKTRISTPHIRICAVPCATAGGWVLCRLVVEGGAAMLVCHQTAPPAL